MCSHYEDASDINRWLAAIGLSYGEPEPFDPAAEYERHPTLYAKPKKPLDMWPRYPGTFIRRHLNADVGDDAVPELEVVAGRWGLISAHTKTAGIDAAKKLATFNARSEKAHSSFTFRHAWSNAQTCIIPADAFWNRTIAVASQFPRALHALTMHRWGSLGFGIAGSLPMEFGLRATACPQSMPISMT